ncbi:tRNA (adenosine(37)-N6)-dimethylallyltransferase MiaA [Paratractidigestivibacter sp.]|uniref:tRNA (adenosine(37)-N6)-dimethylallyltransferase MiaA n=1 Tax=Paratractidigestivibacter sp. TaxID=2847316 RepID=UPI002ABE9E58|nr:tRNA (adenosine(37)-N6)-dimethylallyltransferase MiaA [Paratractidigestivibacter sp.]
MTLPGPAIAIVGPTASGKSTLADLVALELDGDVVSVDAMQVYRGMDIGTAKTPAEERKVALRMIDVCDVDMDYSVQLYQQECRGIVDEELDRGLTPVLCGGTGLYLNAVIDEMVFPSGEKGDKQRSAYEAMAEGLGADGLHALLEERDPASAALIHPNNVRRVVRALEMLDEGKSYAEHNKGLRKRAPHYEARIWGLNMDRARLYARIEQRVDQMMAEGLLDEVRSLMDAGLNRESTAGQAIGYKEILDYLDGDCTLDEAVSAIKTRTRRYAKRQISWFKNDGRVRWLDLDKMSVEEARDIVLADLAGRTGGEA